MNAPSHIPQIDNGAIERYAEVVFGYLDGLVPVRLLSEKGTPDRAPNNSFLRVDEVAAGLQTAASSAAGSARAVYVVPGTVATPTKARAQDIVSTGVVLVDLDDGNIGQKRAHLERHLGPATLVVASGGRTDEGHEKLHLYWRLSEAAIDDDRERVRVLRERIATAVGGDTSFSSLHQPIRVAGTIHGKYGQHALVRILEDRDVEYELGDLEEQVSTLPLLDGCKKKVLEIDIGFTGPSVADLATKRIRAGAADEVTRFEALSKVMGHWIRQVRLGHCSLDDAWTAVVEHNLAMIDPPWDEARLRREFESLRQRDLENHGLPKPVPDPDRPQPHFSDDALATLFVGRFGDDWRHVALWGAWFNWTGVAWQRDETGFIREQVRQICRAATSECSKPSEIRRIGSDKTISAVVRIAASDPAIAIHSDALDAHPMLLNTPRAIYDLETGVEMPHDRRFLLSQVTGASMGKGCPRWETFLDEITGGDADLQGYLQRLAGYLLTGSTQEQMFAFFHGGGANGKSVFIQTIATVLKDYAATATLDTFMASTGSRHLTELAGLRGARMVIVAETESNRAWAEARIKTVTGGEKIRANFMHRDHFEFIPQFKLIVAGNHRPALSGTGEAMARRLHLVPFTVTIPPENRDPDLCRKLAEERDGILGWMLAGCADWFRQGLAPPATVTNAAQRYIEDEDLVGQWLAEACESDATSWAPAKDLYASWSGWAAAGGHVRGTSKSLGDALRQKGFENRKHRGMRGWSGLRLRRSGVNGEDEQ